MPMPQGYLKRVYDIIKKAGGVCISDEVQSGFGRLGTHYWGCEYMGATPDIMAMAKSMGNGFPLAGVAMKKEIGEKLK